MLAPLALAASSVPVSAATVSRLPSEQAGTVASVSRDIARQGNVSIALKGNIANRPAAVPRFRGDTAAALRQLAHKSDLSLEVVSPRAFILKPRSPKLATVVSPVRAASPAHPALHDAAPEPAPEPTDVIVTASKRDTPLQRFAGQWSRIDGDRFSKLGVVGSEAIEAHAVGFTSTHLGAGRNKLFIRGIADSSFSGPTQSPVGQYLGDLRTGYNGPDPDLRLVDMQAVEVMEGPQGTLYGAGAIGGIILLKPNRPNLGTTGAELRIGSALTEHGAPSADVSGTLNLPVGSSAAIRVTGYEAVDGGYVDNRLTGERNINRVRVTGGRAIASARVASGWTVEATGTRQLIRGHDSQYADDQGRGLSRSSPFAQPFRSNFGLASLVVAHETGDLRFKSTLGRTWEHVDERFDASLPEQPRLLLQNSKGRQLSFESRIWRPVHGGWSWLLGLSHIENTYEVSRALLEQGGPRERSGALNHLSETTAYGEVGVALTPIIDATLGGRYTSADLRGSGFQLNSSFFRAIAPIDPQRRERRLLPAAALLSRPAPNFTVYLRYQQGFRPGGLSVASDLVRYYQRDLLATAEAGFRFGKPADWMNLSGSLSQSRWSDIQADYLDSSGVPLTANIGDGRVTSATLSSEFRLSPMLRLSAGAAFNSGRITRPSVEFQALVVASSSLSKVGSDRMQIPNIARWTGRLALDWRRSIGRGWILDADLYARYVGRSRLGIGPKLGEQQGDYFDSGLALRLGDHRRGVSLTASNLTDSVGNRFAFGGLIVDGQNQITPMRPRTVRLGFDWSL